MCQCYGGQLVPALSQNFSGAAFASGARPVQVRVAELAHAPPRSEWARAVLLALHDLRAELARRTSRGLVRDVLFPLVPRANHSRSFSCAGSSARPLPYSRPRAEATASNMLRGERARSVRACCEPARFLCCRGSCEVTPPRARGAAGVAAVEPSPRGACPAALACERGGGGRRRHYAASARRPRAAGPCARGDRSRYGLMRFVRPPLAAWPLRRVVSRRRAGVEGGRAARTGARRRSRDGRVVLRRSRARRAARP